MVNPKALAIEIWVNRSSPDSRSIDLINVSFVSRLFFVFADVSDCFVVILLYLRRRHSLMVVVVVVVVIVVVVVVVVVV